MKKLLNWIWIPLAAIGGLFAGMMIRQPKINKLKKQVLSLQKQLSNLQDRMVGYQESFDNLLLQYKGLKVLQLKKRAEMKGKLEENLVLQYGMKAYLSLLLEKIKNGKKMEKDELSFYKAFDDVIEGKSLSSNQLSVVKDYVMSKYRGQINSLVVCDCSNEFKKIEEYNNVESGS